MSDNSTPRDWPMTRRPLHPDRPNKSPLAEEAKRLRKIESVFDQLWHAHNNWRNEHERVWKAMGYDWARGEPATSSDAVLATEGSYYAALDALAAVVRAPATEFEEPDPPVLVALREVMARGDANA